LLYLHRDVVDHETKQQVDLLLRPNVFRLSLSRFGRGLPGAHQQFVSLNQSVNSFTSSEVERLGAGA
jgi:hypothetical protein